ncbi:MAG: c-type cytochrome [Campylobacteraceae bacterium]
MSWFNLSDNINLLSLIGAAVTLLLTFFVVSIYVKKMKADKSEGEIKDGSWDSIKEYKNPLPLGWALAFVVLCVWAIWYMFVGYPLNSYSQIGEYNKEVYDYNKNFQNKWENLDKNTLLQMGESVFLVQCAPCHGITGDGIGGKAADLTTWGNEVGSAYSIVHGSKGLKNHDGSEYFGIEMFPMAGDAVASEKEAAQASAFMMRYISSYAKSSSSEADIEAGREIWNNSCFSCHGEDGKGMDGMAPDLTTYGTPKFVLSVLQFGKKGHIGDMPNFADGRLTDTQKEAVATYVDSLSK